MRNYCLNCMSILNENGQCPRCGVPNRGLVPEPHHLAPGTILAGKYLIGRVLGEGDSGITYLGCDLRTDTKVAVKEYYPKDISSRISGSNVISFVGSQMNAELYDRGKSSFVREARTVAQKCRQPVMASILDAFEANNSGYVVMEYINGDPLTQLVKHRGGKMRPEELFLLIEPLFTALEQLHAAGMVNRKISPDNVMIENGNVRLADLGAARINPTKLSFAPPEQLNGSGMGAWTDLYALAATIYYCLTGYEPPLATERLKADAIMPPTQLGAKIPGYQENAIMKALCPNATGRFRSAEEMHTALYTAPAFDAIPLDANGKPIKKPMPRNTKIKLIAGIAAAAVVLTLAIVLIAGTGRNNKIETSEGQPAAQTTAAQNGSGTLPETAPDDTTADTASTTAPEVSGDKTTSRTKRTTAAPDETVEGEESEETGEPEETDETEETPEETTAAPVYRPQTTTTTTAGTAASPAVSDDFVISNGVLVKYNGSGGKVTIPDGVTEIGEQVFLGHKALTQVTFPASVRKIGSWAFSDCMNLKKIKMTDSVKTIGDYAFDKCTSLSSITIPAGVKELNITAFSGCSSLSEIKVSASNKYFKDVDGVLFDKNMTTILTFPRNRSEKYYDIPKSVTAIGRYAFTGCSNLKEVTIPQTVKVIGEYAFYKCVNMTTSGIPDITVEIGRYAFYNCGKITKVVIPISVTSIGKNVFYGCDSLKELYYKGSPAQWEKIRKEDLGKELWVNYNYQL